MRAGVAALMFVMSITGCGSSEPAPAPVGGTAPVSTAAAAAPTTKFVVETGPMTLADALDQIARHASVNLVIDPMVSFDAPVEPAARVRANATGTWRAALDEIAASAGCEVEERPGGVYAITARRR